MIAYCEFFWTRTTYFQKEHSIWTIRTGCVLESEAAHQKQTCWIRQWLSSILLFWKKVSGVENGRALKFCFVDVVYQMLFCATQWKCVGVFCFYREIGWAPMLKAKYKNFQNKNVIHKSRLCIFTWEKTWQTVEIRYVDVNIWKIDPRCQVLKPWQMRDEWICQIMVNAVERSDC